MHFDDEQNHPEPLSLDREPQVPCAAPPEPLGPAVVALLDPQVLCLADPLVFEVSPLAVEIAG